jgi:LPS-assembly lipoprotein
MLRVSTPPPDHSMLRTLLLSLLVATLAGCGFQLRQEASLPPEFSRLRLETVDPFSPLGRDLGRALERAGVELTEAPGAAVLRVPVDRLGSAPLTVGESGRVQEYQLRYHVEAELVGADGRVAMPLQAIELTRDYTFDTAQALGSPGEEEVVREELRREMVQAILRRIEAATD